MLCHDARQLSPRNPDSRSPRLRNKGESRFLRLGELQRDEGEEKTRGQENRGRRWDEGEKQKATDINLGKTQSLKPFNTLFTPFWRLLL